MAPPCAAALPGTGGSKGEGYTQLHKEGMGVMKGEGNVNQNQRSGGAVAIWMNSGGEEAMESLREWKEATVVADSLTSGPQEVCQGLNGIIPHIIYFMALGWCPMCQELQKIPTAILTLRCRWSTNTHSSPTWSTASN